MLNSLKWIFTVSLGLVAGLVLAFPLLVVAGFILLIIPGLILCAIPTVFDYLLPTFLIRAILPLRSEVVAHLVAFSLTLGLSAAIMHGFRVRELQRYEQAAIPEIEPPKPLTLAGDIFLQWPQRDFGTENEVNCDFLCTTLLDIPGVTSVTRTCKAGSATFRLGAGHPGTLVLPDNAEQILLAFQRLDDRLGVQGNKRHHFDDFSLRAAWAMRLAGGEELRRDKPLGPEHAEWTIEFVEQQKDGLPKFERMEIRDKDGTVLVRKSRVHHDVPAPMFYFGFELGSLHNCFANSKFTVGSSRISNQPQFYSLEKEVELLRFANIERPAIPQDVGKQLEKAMLQVLEDPNATESKLLLVPMWLSQLPRTGKGEHIEVFGRILLDNRINDPWKLLDRVISNEADLTPMRDGLAKRYLRAEGSEAELWYVKQLINLPDGTFQEPSDDEQAIFRKALSNFRTCRFVERIADRGPSAIPELLSLLEASQEQPSGVRSNLWEGIRNAFKRLGPKAAQAAPKILSMM
ncbi:MAG: hypothetical protein ACK6A7_07345, partial [Planctomycetota bacterium]